MTTPSQSSSENNEQQSPVRYEFPAHKSTVTYLLLGITVLVFLGQQLSNSVFGVDIPAFYLMKINSQIFQGEMWRLITPALVHADILHIGFNMYALFIIGSRLERVYGHERFFYLYLISAFAGNLLSFVLAPYASLGASTAIFGVLAAEGVYIYNNRKFFPQAKQLLTHFLFILVFNLIYSLSNPSIDLWGHLGGLIGGLGFAWFAGPLIQIQYAASGVILKDVHLGTPARITAIIESAVLVAVTIIWIMIQA
jgi:rhomboid protease GluP